jgi:hypothetical protein
MNKEIKLFASALLCRADQPSGNLGRDQRLFLLRDVGKHDRARRLHDNRTSRLSHPQTIEIRA